MATKSKTCTGCGKAFKTFAAGRKCAGCVETAPAHETPRQSAVNAPQMPARRAAYRAMVDMAESLAVGAFAEVPTMSRARNLQQRLRGLGRVGQMERIEGGGFRVWRME